MTAAGRVGLAAAVLPVSLALAAAAGVWAVTACVGGLALGSATDVKVRRIPTRIVTATGCGATLLLVAQALIESRLADLVRSGLVAVTAGGSLGLVWYVAPRMIGLGDVRLVTLVAPVAAFSSWRIAVWTGELTCLAGGAMAVFTRLRRGPGFSDATIPLAPALLAGFSVAVCLR